MMKLDWIKHSENAWYRLNEPNLQKVPDDGVYIIWHDDVWGDEKKCVYVGQGSIKDRLEHHRSNDDVQFYEVFGTLYVTWASVPDEHKNGVEKYLADQLCPSEGEKHPDVLPIEVNLPF